MTDSQKNLGDQNGSEGTSGSTRNSIGSGISGSTSRNTSWSSSLNNRSKIVVSRGAGTTHSTMAGVDPMIRLLEFHGDGSEDSEKHVFMCEHTWEAKRVIDKAEKVV